MTSVDSNDLGMTLFMHDVHWLAGRRLSMAIKRIAVTASSAPLQVFVRRYSACETDSLVFALVVPRDISNNLIVQFRAASVNEVLLGDFVILCTHDIARLAN